MSLELDRLVRTGVLIKEPPDAAEFEGMVERGTLRLADARNDSMSLPGRFDSAYASVHSLCQAALRHAGYRPANRYIVFQTAGHTLGLGADVRFLGKVHELRNRSEYEGDAEVDELLVADLISAAERAADAVKKLPPLPRDS